MAKIVIIGNSAAGFSSLQALINNSGDNEITVISDEEYLPYRRDLLVDYIAGKIEERELFLCPDDFYQKQNIAFLKSNPVIKLEPKKQRLVLKDNTKINYDFLVIASGRGAGMPDIPGKSKDGVFSLYNLKDAEEIRQRLSIVNAVCLAGEAKICLALAQIISGKDKEVKVISGPRPEGFVASDKAEWIEGLKIQDIIGEGSELKALKLDSGKVLGASLILFCGDYKSSCDFLKEAEILAQDGYIIVDDNMRTSRENIFACGSVCSKEGIIKEKSWAEAGAEGMAAAQAIGGLIERGKALCQQRS
jgi:nitrite reductase (NADH) large subunit